jgi:hypothetical protein
VVVTLARQALLYARTARHLRWEQLVYRPIRRLQQELPFGPVPVAAARAGRRESALAECVAAWGSPREGYVTRADAVVAGEFHFLGHTEKLATVDWRQRHVSHLWSYNLHYFDYALDLAWAYRSSGDGRYRDRFVELARSWIDEAGVSRRGDGWEPYPLSLRVVNWIYALLLFSDALGSGDRTRIEASLTNQAEHLSRRLEFHILANHLQKNLKALVVAGLYFEGAAAGRWLADGERMLWQELFEQVLADGTQYEGAPMYHAIALGDFLEVLDLMRAIGRPVPAPVRERVGRMLDALAVLSRPDGTLHLFNDSANGIASDRRWLSLLGLRTLGREVPVLDGHLDLPDAGYHGFVDASCGERLMIDCGTPEPAYQPGHAHCDLLSFELDIGGLPLIVDSGVSGYAGDELRSYVRSTRAHNTVVIAGKEQSEIWGTFRMARRARFLHAQSGVGPSGFRFEGAYRPFHDLRCLHSRAISGAGGRWRVVDRVIGAAGAPLQSFLHLHPAWRVRQVKEGVLATCDQCKVVIRPFGIDELRLVRGERAPIQGWYCPEFGVAMPSWTVEMGVDRNAGEEFGYTVEQSESG